MPDSPGHAGMQRAAGLGAGDSVILHLFLPSTSSFLAFLACPLLIPEPQPPFQGGPSLGSPGLPKAPSRGFQAERPLWTLLPTAGRSPAHPHHQPLLC